MKKKQKEKLRESTIKALEKYIEEEQKKATQIKLETKMGKVKDVHQYKKLKTNIAIAKTMLHEKQLNLNQQNQETKK